MLLVIDQNYPFYRRDLYFYSYIHFLLRKTTNKIDKFDDEL